MDLECSADDLLRDFFVQKFHEELRIEFARALIRVSSVFHPWHK